MNMRTIEISFSDIGDSVLVNIFDPDTNKEHWIMIDDPTDEKITKVIGSKVWSLAKEVE